tara:strand:+ start:1728 stop:1943 length:216 start_codon:yes stop_codon:yes gene_type:complete
VSAEKIVNNRKENLTAMMTPMTSKSKSSGRVDINHLLARVRKEKQEENKINIVFFSLFASLILVVGLILSF